MLPAAPYMIQHLSGNNNALVEQCAWALGNISADCVEYRDVLRANGILKPLLTILQISQENQKNQRNKQILCVPLLRTVDQHHRYTSSGTRQAHSLARTAAFALANQARGQSPRLEDILNLNAAPILVSVLAKNVQRSDEMSDGAGVGILQFISVIT